MMTRKIHPLSLVVLLLPALTGNAQNGTLYTLRMKFVPGATNRYQTNAQIVTSVPLGEGAPPIVSTLDVDLLQSVRVEKVTVQGGGEVATTTQSGRILMNGKTLATPDPTEIVKTTYDSQGNLLKVTGLKLTSAGGGAFGGLVGSGALNLQRVYLPAKAVRLGESWTTKVTVAGLPGAGVGSAKTTLVRFEPVGRYQTARLRAVLSAPLKLYLTADSRTTTDPKRAAQSVTGTLKMTFDSNFAMTEGKVVRSGGSGTAVVNLTPTAKQKPVAKTTNLKAVAKPRPPVSPPLQVTIQLRVGNNLIE